MGYVFGPFFPKNGFDATSARGKGQVQETEANSKYWDTGFWLYPKCWYFPAQTIRLFLSELSRHPGKLGPELRIGMAMFKGFCLPELVSAGAGIARRRALLRNVTRHLVSPLLGLILCFSSRPQLVR